MQYELGKIRKHNIKAHIDIGKDIHARQNGNFSFVLRMFNGNIVDYTVVEYVDVGKYIAQELVFSLNDRK